MREHQRRNRIRNRLLIILSITAGAVIIFSLLILPGLKSSDASNIIQITPIAKRFSTKGTSMGNPAASVKMDVWEDFQCSGCWSYTKNLEPRILQTYVDTGKVYYTFHFYPFIDGGQGESHDAANGTMCASAQNRFWDYHNMLFANWKGENAGSFTRPRLVAFAQAIVLDMTSFNKCFQENTYSIQIQQDIDEGSKLGVPPTPGIFVNGKVVASSAGKNYIPSVDDISHAIEANISGK